MTDYERFDEHPTSMQRNGDLGLAFTLLLIGLGVGALAGLLLAPKTGKQMRRSLRRKYQDAREVLDDWSDQAGDIIDRGSDWASSARDRGADWANLAKDKVEPLRRAVRSRD